MREKSQDPSPQASATRGGGVLSPSLRPGLILCLGNPDRGDDGVGHLVGLLLREQVPQHVVIEYQDGSALELLERLHGVDSALFVDAALTGAPPGTVHVFDCTAGDMPAAKPGASSHGLGIAEAIAMARVLHELPRVCRLYAIEGVNFTPGASISAAVRVAAEKLAAMLACAAMV